MNTTLDNYKNRNREKPTFANINLLGKCNVDCYFCLGKDIPELLNKHNQLSTPFNYWENFRSFLEDCQKEGIKKIYLTGQNTDPLLYYDLGNLIDFLQDDWGFKVGIRTNGYNAIGKMDCIKKCKEEIGYSIHSINPITNKMMIGRRDIPDWNYIIPETVKAGMPVRVAVVITRCNYHEFGNLMRYLANFNLPYIQIRKVSSDTRRLSLAPDMDAYERLYTEISRMFPLKERLWEDAEVYDVFGANTCWWRTVKTSINSWNYFTDGTISKQYFIVEGYQNNYKKAN